MGRFVVLALAVALSLSACSDDGGTDRERSEAQPPKADKYAHMLDALAALEGGEQDDDATFTPGAGPRKAAAEQNKALGWSARTEFRFAERHVDDQRSCIVSDDAYLVVPGPDTVDYYIGDGTTCSYDRADAEVVYRFVNLTDDGGARYRAVKGADLAPRKVTVPIVG